MTLTNELHLPQPLVDALTKNDYSKGVADYSVTQLIGPARISQLRKLNSQNLSDDVSNMIFAMFGKAIHSVLEKAASDQYLIEKRFCMVWDDALVSGQIDLYEKKSRTLQDWKICSYHVASDGAKPEWIAQGNINRFIMQSLDIPVDKIEYITIFRDWSKMMAARKPNDYPQRQVQVISIPMWSHEKTGAFMSERIQLHREAEKVLPMCSSEERWERKGKWAVMQRGKKRAVRLHDMEDEAEVHASSLPNGFVEERPGENVRCLFYCDVAPFCSFGRQVIQDAGEK